MKKLIVVLMLASGVVNAAFVPVAVTKQNQAAKLMDVRERVAQEIANAAAYGYHYIAVNIEGADWKTEKEIMKELQALGYKVDFANRHGRYGWNDLNGALLIKW